MKTLEAKLEYTFQDISLLEHALTHSSYANESHGRCTSNERLEFLGDSVLGMVVADHLFRTCGDMPEGDLTRTRAALVREENLVEVAHKLDLGSYLRLGKGEELCGGRQRPSIQADAVEAVLAAVYLDGGIGSVRKIIHRFILDNAVLATKTQDYKTALQEIVQRQPGSEIVYELVGESGPDHCRVFVMEVSVNGEVVGRGEGHSKKAAEQMAAKAAIETLRE
ncbi:MAG: ribonuclease III [Oscillospiraceae bacterium]|nr:ribonuclease III [Oscillospiraceae bacterium]